MSPFQLLHKTFSIFGRLPRIRAYGSEGELRCGVAFGACVACEFALAGK